MNNYFTCLSIVVAALLLVGCIEPKVGGMLARDIFKDEKDIKLANYVANGDVGKIHEIIDSGGDPNAVGYDGVSLLIWGVGSKSVIGIKALIDNGADPGYKTPSGVSAVTLAAGAKGSELLEALLEGGADPNMMENGRPAIHIVVDQMRVDNLNVLINYGVDVNATNNSGITAAENAVMYGRYDMVVMMLNAGFENNLEKVASFVGFRKVPEDSVQNKWRDEVIEILKRRKIKGLTRHPP